MKKVYIIGAGGHALVVKSIIDTGNKFKVEGFIKKDGEDKNLLKIKNERSAVSIAIGDNKKRGEIFKKIKTMGIKIISAVHPSAIIAPDVILGEGLVICAGSVICTRAKIMDNTIINTASSIDHETIVGKNCHIAPGVHLAGKVVIGDNSLVGIGVSVIPNTKIGKNSVIGAGAVVIDNVSDNTMVAGVPAKVIKHL